MRPPLMAGAGSVVITGASRGLGLATATHLYRQGWTVVAAMRSPGQGLERLRTATGASPGDGRLIGVPLDLVDPASIADAAAAIQDAVGAPDGLVHNAGVAGVGCLEELPLAVWERILATNLLGPVRLTKHLLPAMRVAGRGRVVMISSQGAIAGIAATGAYAAAKGGLERWAESLAQEIAPFGLGVTVIVTGSFKTDILELTETYADPDGPYGPLHEHLERSGRRFLRLAGKPERFAPAVERALGDRRPLVRRAVGFDAHLFRLGKAMLPTPVLQGIVGRALRLPSAGALVGDPLQMKHVREREISG